MMSCIFVYRCNLALKTASHSVTYIFIFFYIITVHVVISLYLLYIMKTGFGELIFFIFCDVGHDFVFFLKTTENNFNLKKKCLGFFSESLVT